MATSHIKAVLPHPLSDVWEALTAVEGYPAWRSDLSRIEVHGSTQFVEYTKEGYATTFTVTAMEPCQRWEFDMENSNMRGHWTGLFSEADGGTEIAFTEHVTAKKLLLRPFVGAYLQRQQAKFLEDLKKTLLG